VGRRHLALDGIRQLLEGCLRVSDHADVEAAQLGARSMVEQKIGGLRNAARQGTALHEADFNLQKFQILFGMKEATRLAKLLRDEKDIADTNARLFAGSATAERLTGQEACILCRLPSTHARRIGRHGSTHTCLVAWSRCAH
jgi:hypothetical protein